MENARSDTSLIRTALVRAALEVGVVIAPRVLRDVGEGLAAELTEQLQVRYRPHDLFDRKRVSRTA